MPNRTTVPAPTRPAPAGRRTNPLDGPVPILATALLWGTTGTASSLAPAGAPAAGIGAAALVLGGLLLFLSTRSARALPRTCGRRERWLLVVGAVAVVGYPISFYPAVSRTGVAVATVIALGSAPVFTGLLGWLARQGRPTGRWACATATAVVGCAVLVLGPELTGGATAVDATGVVLAALAGLSYAAYSLVGGKLIRRGHPSAGVMGAMFGGAALLVLPVLLLGDVRWIGTARGAAVVLHLAVITTFLAYRLFGHGLRHISAQAATTLTLAEPAVAAVLGVAALGERLPAVSWSGLAVLAAGLALLALPTRPVRRRP
ncbi:DME family drug/metabolite transporter [Kitasatospora sp. MAA19]|uniref:EamA family transporter n=1 Tax=Kitasatospora sp. MAA19 TaxID=3035090 RepID=UPI002475C4D7|nr:EamA family transporter [Kitasatospora sp. MAA19]MDH6704956.1 DME family drug/metabolite transporter [Kitasatospora sp. MAA19]